MAEYSLNAWGMKPTKHGDSFRIWWKQNNRGVDQDFETEVGLMNCLMNHLTWCNNWMKERYIDSSNLFWALWMKRSALELERLQMMNCGKVQSLGLWFDRVNDSTTSDSLSRSKEIMFHRERPETISWVQARELLCFRYTQIHETTAC